MRVGRERHAELRPHAIASRDNHRLAILTDVKSRRKEAEGIVQLPLFLVILGSIVAGLLVGFVWEWIREYGQRAEAARQAREMRRLEREVARLKGEKHQGKDEVLALLDEAS